MSSLASDLSCLSSSQITLAALPYHCMPTMDIDDHRFERSAAGETAHLIARLRPCPPGTGPGACVTVLIAPLSRLHSALYASGRTDLLQDAQNAARATKVAYLDYLRLSGQARVYRNQGHFARCDRKWDEASHALFDALNHRVQ